MDLLVKEFEEAKKRELEFDPRKHRLQHGIRDLDINKIKYGESFKGTGTKLG